MFGDGTTRGGRLAILAVAASLAAQPSWADPVEPYVIAVHISHDANAAGGEPQSADAIVDLVTRRVALLNKAGGIHRRPVKAVFYDDFEDERRTRENVSRALADPNLIAMIGLWDSSRGEKVIDEIGASRVPLISELSVETLFKRYPTIYTLTRSVRHEQEVLENFVKARGFSRIAFVGAVDDDLYTKAYHEYIMASGMRGIVVAEERLRRLSENSPQRVAEAVATVKRENPDLIFLSLGSSKGAAFLRELAKESVAADVFLGRGSVIEMQKADSGGVDSYRGPIYELAEGGIANLLNERLEQIKRNPDIGPVARKYAEENKQLSYGARYGDLVALIVESANTAAKPQSGATTPYVVREAVAASLASYKEGRKVFRGLAQDWSFTTERASSERSLLVWRPAGKTVSTLAPLQYVETGSGLTEVPVLQVHLDMLRMYRVDPSDRSFEADFFLTLHGEGGVAKDIVKFTNAYRAPGEQEGLVNIRQIHQEPSGAETPTTRIFKVSGKFLFEPDLRKFPFDEQIFSVSFQPSNTSAPFLLQPPAESILAYKFPVDGWEVRDAYVGSNDLIIRSVAGALAEQRMLPYYNFNYTWVMKRQIVDYVVRVLTPLGLILIVSYLANFIPRRDFDATIAIQVTGLLSAIALYLALNQPSADDATLSDKVFVVAYVTISAMIALSIAEVNKFLARSKGVQRFVNVLQFVVVPVVATAYIGKLIIGASSDDSLIKAVERLFVGS